MPLFHNSFLPLLRAKLFSAHCDIFSEISPRC
jgi:hypothetical protein